VGTDGTGIPSLGGSCVINPVGVEMLRMDEAPGLGYALLDLEKLREFRVKFPAMKDADDFTPLW
jgi:predicted amidohydrolase